MDPTIPASIPPWIGWVLTAIIIPSGVWLAHQFISFLRMKEEATAKAQSDFREFLQELHDKTEADRKEERSSWQAGVATNTRTVEQLATSVREWREDCRRQHPH